MTFDNVDWEAPRPLLLLIAQADGSLKAAASNTSLVLCKQCGGMMGDPYQSTTIKPFQFVIDFYGGSSWRWSTSYTFRYDKVKKDWFLYSDASTSFQSGDPDNTTEHSIVMRKETGDISLQNFTPYYNADSSIWKVNAAKAFFYRSPQLGSGPKKLYLVKGDIVNSYKKLNNFIQCSFTNAKGVTTSGYILKRDLLLIEANKPKAIQ